VPKGTSRLRVALSAAHTEISVKLLRAALDEIIATRTPVAAHA
jgi:7-keto-8-aminopelargonate synthetase-like enzyme